ncbi:LysM peptidoglycan-binding domain-containing protein [Leadbetterella byssophila]|uniref:LysM peptidoglycan-binding domain-containing protein n=1 Tax=Leadbetterella byssophila TaxID=316068 RepID=UPI00399F3B13
MEYEERNRKPKQGASNTPAVVLVILFAIVVLLLYAGWNLMSDDASNIVDMKSIDSDLVQVDEKPVEEEDEDIVEEVTLPEPEKKEEKKEEVTPVVEKPTTSYKGETSTYTVKAGETFFAIANKFNTSSDNLQALNPDVNPSLIKEGVTKLKVPVQAVHTVGPGDILRVVANKYGISVEALMAANGKKKNFAERGEKLLIPHKNKI